MTRTGGHPVGRDPVPWILTACAPPEILGMRAVLEGRYHELYLRNLGEASAEEGIFMLELRGMSHNLKFRKWKEKDKEGPPT